MSFMSCSGHWLEGITKYCHHLLWSKRLHSRQTNAFFPCLSARSWKLLTLSVDWLSFDHLLASLAVLPHIIQFTGCWAYQIQLQLHNGPPTDIISHTFSWSLPLLLRFYKTTQQDLNTTFLADFLWQEQFLFIERLCEDLFCAYFCSLLCRERVCFPQPLCHASLRPSSLLCAKMSKKCSF